MLDWFHLTMKITVLQQCARGLSQPKATHPVPDAAAVDEEDALERRLESAKHYLWHGNCAMALDRLQEVEDDLELRGCDENGEKKLPPATDSATRMRKDVRELETYSTNNATSIVNDGERYRHGERIRTAFTASTINQVGSKRMVKQQMQ